MLLLYYTVYRALGDLADLISWYRSQSHGLDPGDGKGATRWYYPTTSENYNLCKVSVFRGYLL